MQKKKTGRPRRYEEAAMRQSVGAKVRPETREWVRAEAERRSISEAEMLRRCIELVRAFARPSMLDLDIESLARHHQSD